MDSKRGKILASIMILLIIIFFIGMGVATWRSDRDESAMIEKRCQDYCNCSIYEHHCYYTFDYNDVKDCECNGN